MQTPPIQKIVKSLPGRRKISKITIFKLNREPRFLSQAPELLTEQGPPRVAIAVPNERSAAGGRVTIWETKSNEG